MITALLLTSVLVVTRQVDADGSVCAFITDINPQATSVQVRFVGTFDAFRQTLSFPPGTESVCVPLTIPREDIRWFEARQVYPIRCNPTNPASGDIICGDPELSWHQEPKLWCEGEGEGCDTMIYQAGP